MNLPPRQKQEREAEPFVRHTVTQEQSSDIIKRDQRVTRDLLDRELTEHYGLPTKGQLSLEMLPGNRALRFLSPFLRVILGEKIAKRTLGNLRGWLERRRQHFLKRQALLQERLKAEERSILDRQREREKTRKQCALERRRREEAEHRAREEAKERAVAAKKKAEEERMKARAARAQAYAEQWKRMQAPLLRLQERFAAWQKEQAARRVQAQAERQRKSEEEKQRREAGHRAREEAKVRREEERKCAAKEAQRKKEEKRTQLTMQRAARRAVWKACFKKWFAPPVKQSVSASPPVLDEARLRAETDSGVQAQIMEEAKKEAMRQVLIEQEKTRLRSDFAKATPDRQGFPPAEARRAEAGGGQAELLSTEREKEQKVHAGALEERERRIVEREKRAEEERAVLEAERRKLADTTAKTSVGGSPAIDPATLEVLKKELAAALAEKTQLQNQVTTHTKGASRATKAEATAEWEKKLAAERATLELEKERIRADALAEAERRFAAEREAMKAAATAQPRGGAANEAPAQTAFESDGLVSELRKQLAAAEATFALEREKLRAEALAEAEAKLRTEFTSEKGGGKTGAPSSVLAEELEKWKKQVEKLEQERRELEQRRALQEEQERTQKEQKRLEEERMDLERQRIARERAALDEDKMHKIRIAESKEQLKEEKKQLEEEKKKALAALSFPVSKRPASTPGKNKAETTKKGEEKGGSESNIDIGKILLSQNYIDETELKDALAKSKERNVALELVLKDEGLVTKELLQNAIAEYYKMSFIDLRSQPPDPSVLELLPQSFSVSFNVVAIQKQEDGSLVVATSNPEQTNLIAEIRRILPTVPNVSLVCTSKESIESALGFYQKPLETRFRSIIEQRRKVAPEIIEEIFSDAVQLGASDIHFEPQEKIIVVRFRVDGVMHEAGRIPREYYEGIVNRIKIAGNMRIDEHFSAQDGAIRWRGEKGRAMDVRVSIVPIVDGEKIVLRLLSEYIRTLTLSDLGFTSAQRELLVEASDKPFGMILTTGPTGSGKSTTLYGLMKICNTPDVNISTIEDPVEYKVLGINHIQVNLKTDLTFERGLRALVRQDPDIILVGEIRDNITAQISVNAALTGHLLFSTLHANDAATAIPRLLEMEVEPYLLASTLELIIAQRLMRRICMHCRYSEAFQREQACNLFKGAERYFGPEEQQVTLYRGKGCPACGGTGYRSRIGVYEILVVTPTIEQMIVERRTTAEINTVARREGMLTLFEDGLQKVKAGLSTIDELLRVAAPPELLLDLPSAASHTKR